jgi:hypothetical protein
MYIGTLILARLQGSKYPMITVIKICLRNSRLYLKQLSRKYHIGLIPDIRH